MGQVPRSKLIILSICLLLTGTIIFTSQPKAVNKKGVSLDAVLRNVPGWKMNTATPLEKRIRTALKLDDYVNASFSDGKNTVSLYIGYYFTDKKLGAAHNPMVCFPGQGWTVSRTKTGALVFGSPEPYKISFSSMVVKRADQRELVIYWFQSYDKANTNTFSQKVSSFFQRLHHGSQGNAFIRITTNLKGKTGQEAQRSIEAFIRAFYPIFIKYIKNEIP